MSDIIQGLQAVTIHVTDIQKARNFYQKVMGMREVAFDERQNRAVFAIPGTTTILSMHIMGPNEGGREPGTVSGLVFHNPDPKAACDEIKHRGGTITVEPMEFEAAGSKFVRAAVADPDGNEFIISSRRN
jgi:predicted enzyme related to lactoylglutathione lyase